MLTVGRLVEANKQRATHWHSVDGWSPLEWAGAMCGEAGEAANVAKKMTRILQQVANKDARLYGQNLTLDEQLELHRKEIGKEVADTVIYGILLCQRVGADFESSLREVFNKKSEEYGFPERI